MATSPGNEVSFFHSRHSLEVEDDSPSQPSTSRSNPLHNKPDLPQLTGEPSYLLTQRPILACQHVDEDLGSGYDNSVMHTGEDAYSGDCRSDADEDSQSLAGCHETRGGHAHGRGEYASGLSVSSARSVYYGQSKGISALLRGAIALTNAERDALADAQRIGEGGSREHRREVRLLRLLICKPALTLAPRAPL